MKLLLRAAAPLLLIGALCAAAPAPRLGRERLVLRTTAGDVVLAFYPGVAPRHVARVLELARLGVYDGARFSSVAPGFYAEVGETAQRAAPLTSLQAAAVAPLRAEFSSLHHRRGVLSMARQPSDPNSARTAFSIFLGDWSQGDGRYTVFGEVVAGLDVVDTIAEAPADPQGRPLSEIQIYKAQVMDQGALASAYLAPAHLIVSAPAAPAVPASSDGPWRAVAGGVAFMLLAAAAALACARFHPRAVAPLLLVDVLAGAFLLLVLLGPAGPAHPWLGAALFLGLLGTLRLMSSFESQA